MKNIIMMCALVCYFRCSLIIADDTSKSSELSQAIATLRHVDPNNILGKKDDVKRKALEEACKNLVNAGKEGVDIVKNELEKIDMAKEKDDYFKLVAGSILWKNGKVEEAINISEIWSSVDNLDYYSGVYDTACEAALTQDQRVLPILIATLRDKKSNAGGSLYWALFGSKGGPAVREVLKYLMIRSHSRQQ